MANCKESTFPPIDISSYQAFNYPHPGRCKSNKHHCSNSACRTHKLEISSELYLSSNEPVGNISMLIVSGLRRLHRKPQRTIMDASSQETKSQSISVMDFHQIESEILVDWVQEAMISNQLNSNFCRQELGAWTITRCREELPNFGRIDRASSMRRTNHSRRPTVLRRGLH